MFNKIIISLNSIINNYNVIKKNVGNTEVFPVLKADAYGTGAIEVARALIENGCNNFFVYNLSEALELKTEFGKKINNIYVLSGIDKDEEEFFHTGKITPVILSFKQLELYSNFAKSKNKVLDIGLHFNTGMNRSGFQLEFIDKIKDFIKNKENYLNVNLVISHFACGDEPKHELTIKQIDNFKNIILNSFPEKNIKKSFAASDGIFCLKKEDVLYDIVRPGIGLVGTSLNRELLPVLEVKTFIEKIDNNKAIIPFGTAHGLFSCYVNNNGYALINGKKANFTQINKNYSTLNIENIDTKINDEVIILGKSISIDEISEKSKIRNNTLHRNEIQARFIQSKTKNTKVFYKLNSKTFEKKEINKCFLDTLKINIKLNKNKINIIESKILEIRKIQEEGFCGYGATAKVKIGDVLAVVYGGYSDGVSRWSSNTGNVYVNSHPCKIIGRVSMDQTTILLNDKIKNKVKIGDKAYFLKEKENPREFLGSKDIKTDEALSLFHVSKRVNIK